MEREQFKVLVKAMKAVYAQPTFIPDQDAFNVWFTLLGDLPYKQAELAVQKHMATEKFPPTIADIREKAEQITSVKETEMSELEAWAIVRKAIGRSNYYAEEEFEKLPEACKMAVGNPSNLREWAMMDSDQVGTVEQSHFVRNYRTAMQRIKEDRRMPEKVRTAIAEVKKQQMQIEDRQEKPKSRSDNKKGGRVMAGEEKQIVVEETTVVPGKMEFRLISPTESNFLKHIEWNKEELLAAVRNKVALYEGIVYTEETVKTAKNDRAELNNLVKAIDERRKKVKEVINQPYAEFEKELKEITDLIKKQSAEIDEQVKAFETAEKEEKRAKIMEAYEKAVGNLAEILPFSKVFEQRYLNKTCKLESAIADVQKKIEQVKTDLETIESVCGKYKLNAKDIYVRTLDLSKAMAEEKRLKDLEEKLEAERIQKEKAAEERRKAEEARKAEAERIRKEEEQKEIERQKKAEEERIAAEKAEAEKKQSVLEMSQDVPTEQAAVPEKEENVPTQETEPAVDPFAQARPVPEKKCRTKFFAIGTRDQLKALVAYMKESGIKYGKVE